MELTPDQARQAVQRSIAALLPGRGA
jgi:hypothetical protein